MKVTKIRDDVWKFKGSGSVYLIVGEKNILIDAGDPLDKDELKREISKVVSVEKIDAVLMTHLHYDHLGSLDLFLNAEIFVSKEELEDYMKDAKGFHFYVSEEIDEIFKRKARPFPLAKEEAGGGKQVAEIFGLEVLKVPGHTRGSVAFLDEKRKLLFSGDTIFGGGISGRIDLPNSLPDKMEKSTRMLRKLVAEKSLGLCPGHGYWEDQQ
jgi:glyoxylase-like metal-dependent hydrolase (beta-lactamase superfamily II)